MDFEQFTLTQLKLVFVLYQHFPSLMMFAIQGKNEATLV
jgi:hypothetical protein